MKQRTLLLVLPLLAAMIIVAAVLTMEPLRDSAPDKAGVDAFVFGIQCTDGKVSVESPDDTSVCIPETIITDKPVAYKDDGTLDPKGNAATSNTSSHACMSPKIVTACSDDMVFDNEISITPMGGLAPWAIFSYPECVEIGEPFEINYTYTYVKTYRESAGDGSPRDNPDRCSPLYPWESYDTWEDENGMAVWQVVRDRHDAIDPTLRISAPKEMIFLSDGFKTNPHRFGYEKIVTFPFDLIEDHKGSVTFRIDEPPVPRNHSFYIGFGIDSEIQRYVHFDGTRIYLSERPIMIFDSHGPKLASVPTDLPNPLHCISERSWSSRSDDQKRWEYLYPSGHCNGKEPYKPYKPPPSEKDQMTSQMNATKLWLDRHNVTENIESYLRNTLYFPDYNVEWFFKVYPELVGQFVFSPSFLLPKAHATHGDDHLAFVCGTFNVTDPDGNSVSPVGASVCLYDRG